MALNSIELFTGAGGLALGATQAGFRHLALVEFNRDAVRTVRENWQILAHRRTPCALHAGDVADFDFGQYAGRVDLLAAGAPCQPWSLGGKHGGHEDERNLFPDVFRAVRDVAPRAVLIENVRGLLRSAFADYVAYIELQLSMPEYASDDPEDWRSHLGRLRKARESGGRGDLRYVVTRHVFNAADFGVAQKRERVFMVGIRSDLNRKWLGLSATHSEDALVYAQWVSGEYWEEAGVPRPKMPDPLKRRVEQLRRHGRPLLEERWRTVRDVLRGLPEPMDSREHPTILNHVGYSGARTYPGHTGSPYDWPAKTIKAGGHGVPGGENMLRREDGSVRYFSIREAARLQSFPDSFRFHGAWGEALRQIGNAVPVTLAAAVSSSVAQLIMRKARRAAPAAA